MQYHFDYEPRLRSTDVRRIYTLPTVECRVTLRPSRWTAAEWEVERLDVLAFWKGGIRCDMWTSDWVEVDRADPLYERALVVLSEPEHKMRIAIEWQAYVRDISTGDIADAIERRYAEEV